MKRLLIAIAAVALVAMVVPVAMAQTCLPSIEFASYGAAMAGFKTVTVDNGSVEDAGNEIGRFWESGNSNNGNNFGGNCPSTNVGAPADSWWDIHGGTGNRGVRGFIGGGTCDTSPTGCPSNELTVVVEEWGTSGPPGVNDTAHFISWRVSETGNINRVYDLARPSDDLAVLDFNEFPTPDVTGSIRLVPSDDVSLTSNYADIGLNFHGVSGTCESAGNCTDTPLSASGTLLTYDLCVFRGTADPGRWRNPEGTANDWDCSSSLTYEDAEVNGHKFVAPCPDQDLDTFVAIGVTFDGGAGPDIPSMLVGRAVQVECDPNMAEPEEPRIRGIRPNKRKVTRSGR